MFAVQELTSEIDVDAPVGQVQAVLLAIDGYEGWFPDVASDAGCIACTIPLRIGRPVQAAFALRAEREVVSLRLRVGRSTVVEHTFTLRPAGPWHTVVRHRQSLRGVYGALVDPAHFAHSHQRIAFALRNRAAWAEFAPSPPDGPLAPSVTTITTVA
jgi:hypothetical protein